MEGYNAVLELFKASHAKIFPEEEVLDKLNSWTSHFLREELSTFMTNDLQNVFEEVDYALKFPLYANLDRLEHKRNIEQSRIEDFQILKTACIIAHPTASTQTFGLLTLVHLSGTTIHPSPLVLEKHYKEELLKIKQKLAEASGTSLEDIQVPLAVQMSIFIDKKKKRGGLGCSSNVGSSSHAISVGASGEEVHMLRGQVNQLQATVNKLLRSVKRITARCAANFPPDDADAADDDDDDADDADDDADDGDGDDFPQDIYNFKS